MTDKEKLEKIVEVMERACGVGWWIDSDDFPEVAEQILEALNKN